MPLNGQPYIPTALGRKWFHTYDRRIYPYPGNAHVLASALRPNGEVRYFGLNGREKIYLGRSALLEPQYSGGSLTGWRLTSDDHEVEEYDADGKLLTLSRFGAVQTLAYSDGSTPASIAPFPGLLVQVTDQAGRTLDFRYDAAGRLIKMIDPAGNEYLYTYDESTAVLKAGEMPSGDLTSVTYPQTGSAVPRLIYHYNEPVNFNPPATIGGTNLYTRALTGISNELGVRIATYQYSADTLARAFHTYGALTTNRFSLSQSGATQQIVNNQLGAWKRYSYANPINGSSPFLAGATRVRTAQHACASGVSGCLATSTVNNDADGYAINRNSFNSVRTTFTWNKTRGLETQRVEALTTANATTPATRTISTQWHSTFNLPTLITESGRTTAFTYDANGNVLTRTVTDTVLSKSRTWTYTYDSFGNVATMDGPRTDVSDVTTYGYDSAGNLTSVTNPAGHVTSITSHDAHGRPLTIVDPNGLSTTLAYNARGWVSSSTTGSEVTTYDHDAAGKVTRTTFPDASYLDYGYDAASRLIEITDALGNKIVYTYDSMSNRTKDEVFEAGTTLVQTRSRAFNALLRQTQDIGGTNPASQITTYGYDNEGNVISSTDPLGRVTSYTYDQLNRLTQVTAPGANITKYAYNARDQLTSVIDPRNNSTTYTVNALDDLTQQVSPDTSTTVNTYDAAGNLLTSRDAKNQTTTYSYDALNRVTLATFHDASSVEYGYDAGINGKGHLTSLTEKDPAGAVVTTTSYAYNAHGRLLADTRMIGGVNYVTAYGYDSAGRMNSLTYPSGRVLSYSFDAAGRISGINTVPPGGGSPVAVVSGITYQPFGGVKGFTYGNSQTYSRTYDLDGRIAGFTLPGQSHTVSFDAASRITGATHLPNPAQSNTYGYDNLDRLTSAVMPLTSHGFTYDANGNRITKTVGANSKTYTYPSTNNRLSTITGGGTQTFVHDPAGSITADGTNTFGYDTRGRLTSAATALGAVTYGVNALGQRYAKTLGGTTTVYLYDQAGKLIAETTPAGATLTEYVHLGDLPVALFR